MTPRLIQLVADFVEWRPVPGFEGRYEVNDQGVVRRCARIYRNAKGKRHALKARVLSIHFHGDRGAYPYVTLQGEKRKRLKVALHRIVLLAFVGPPPEPDMQASHEPDPDPSNCKLSNLRWRSHADNQQERAARYAGMTWEEIQALLDPPDPDARYTTDDAYEPTEMDPVLTGETPF